MPLTLLQKIALGISGITASCIGALILAAPHLFYESYGISLGNDTNLLSELRALRTFETFAYDDSCVFATHNIASYFRQNRSIDSVKA